MPLVCESLNPCTPRLASLSAKTSVNVKMSLTDASQRGPLCSSSLGGTFKKRMDSRGTFLRYNSVPPMQGAHV